MKTGSRFAHILKKGSGKFIFTRVTFYTAANPYYFLTNTTSAYITNSSVHLSTKVNS